MANRYTVQFVNALEKKVVKIFAHVTFGASGAPTLDNSFSSSGASYNSKGVVSVTKNNTGLYTFVFGTQTGNLDTYVKFLHMDYTFDETGNGGTAPAAPLSYLTANNISTVGTSSLQFQFTNNSNSPTNPANGEGLYIEFTFGDSTAP